MREEKGEQIFAYVIGLAQRCRNSPKFPEIYIHKHKLRNLYLTGRRVAEVLSELTRIDETKVGPRSFGFLRPTEYPNFKHIFCASKPSLFCLSFTEPKDHSILSDINPSPLPSLCLMTSGPQNIGGEYGKIRASIDIDNLNAYLSKHILSTGIKPPIEVKQFKVSIVSQNITGILLTSSCLKFGQVSCCCFPFIRFTSNMAILVKSHIFLDRYQVSIN